jgi:hypothetical protein
MRDQTAMMLRQLLGCEGWAEIGISLADDGQCQGTNLGRKPTIARLAAPPRQQAWGAILLEPTQQAEHLPTMQTHQRTGVGDTQPSRLNPQQHVEPAELLLAHRQHRHDASPGTPKPERVSSLFCRGVPSLYCCYTLRPPNRHYAALTIRCYIVSNTARLRGRRSPQQQKGLTHARRRLLSNLRPCIQCADCAGHDVLLLMERCAGPALERGRSCAGVTGRW